MPVGGREPWGGESRGGRSRGLRSPGILTKVFTPELVDAAVAGRGRGEPRRRLLPAAGRALRARPPRPSYSWSPVPAGSGGCVPPPSLMSVSQVRGS
ncbi:hypothetical protein EAO76_16160 [Streptomyces sp. sk2.1]|nr:hypothetical protein EAO76_16160 [Streptomyces sp. sk2.1]